MDTKLTLKLDQEVIEKAKRFAQGQQTSLSQLIENYYAQSDAGGRLPFPYLSIGQKPVRDHRNYSSASTDVYKAYREHLRQKYA